MKIAEGCDRSCGFCAIPSFRGPQRSRDVDVDPRRGRASSRRRRSCSSRRTSPATARTAPTSSAPAPSSRWCGRSAAWCRWTRLLYLYPSDLTDELIDAICATGVPYFDLSLQHVSKPLLRRMRRWGDGERFLRRIADIRDREPDAAFRSNFIVGYPGETEEDHDQLLALRRGGRSSTGAASSPTAPRTAPTRWTSTVRSTVGLMDERLAELREMQDDITAVAQRRT